MRQTTGLHRTFCLIAMLSAALLWSGSDSTALTRIDPADLCLTAARDAARQHSVPDRLMQAVTLTETGRAAQGMLRPWPWAVNLGGEGHWFPSRAEAEAFVAAALAEGRTNIDIGCFQLNHRWHGAGFGSVEAMFDPEQNAAHAAKFLARLYARHGDWTAAVGAYHSGTPAVAERYLARFESVYAGLGGEGAAPQRLQPQLAVLERTNPFPLLRPGATGRGGSLVPLLAGGTRLIGD